MLTLYTAASCSQHWYNPVTEVLEPFKALHPSQELLTLTQAAVVLGMCKGTFLKHYQKEKFPFRFYRNSSGYKVVRRTDLIEYLSNLEEVATTKGKQHGVFLNRHAKKVAA